MRLSAPNADCRSQINEKIAQAPLKTTTFDLKNSFQAENASNELIMSNFGACEANFLRFISDFNHFGAEWKVLPEKMAPKWSGIFNHFLINLGYGL